MSFLQEGVYTPKDDFKYFRELPKEEKKKYLDTIEDLKNKHRIEKPKIRYGSRTCPHSCIFYTVNVP